MIEYVPGLAGVPATESSISSIDAKTASWHIAAIPLKTWLKTPLSKK